MRALHMIADGDYLMWAVRTMLGRTPAPAERIDFGQLKLAMSDIFPDKYGPRRVTVHYFQRNWPASHSFFWTLEHRFGFTMHLFDPDTGLTPVKEAIAQTLQELEEVDCDVVMAGGDSQFADQLRKLVSQRASGGIPRKVGVAYLDGWCEIALPNDTELKMLDLVHDLGAAPEALYAARQNAQAQPPATLGASRLIGSRLPLTQPGRLLSRRPPAEQPLDDHEPILAPGIGDEQGNDIPSLSSDLLEALLKAATESSDDADPIEQPAEHEPVAAEPSPETQRPLLVLIDHENIDWCLGDMIGAANLNQSTRPQWPLLKRYLEEGAGDGPLRVHSYLQHNQANANFAKYLDKELGFYPELLQSEEHATQPNQRQPVVDYAIYDMLAELKTRHCDVVIVSNDGGYFPHLEELRVNGFDRDRQFSVIGFADEMAADYAKADWINVIDLEHDIGAFTYALPRRYTPTRLSDYQPAKSLGDFGLKPIAGDRPAVEPEAAGLGIEADDE